MIHLPPRALPQTARRDPQRAEPMSNPSPSAGTRTWPELTPELTIAVAFLAGAAIGWVLKARR